MCANFIMKKVFQFKSKSYSHLDKMKHSQYLEKSIKNPEWIAKHGFLPLIHVKMLLKKRNGSHKRFSFKIRHIFYSSHTDSYIYQWYANLLSEQYEKYIKDNNFNEVPTAYRSLNGKCNIDFAKEAFVFLKEQENAFLFVTDFHSFFDSLNHKLLKNNLMKVLNMPSGLRNDWYAIYKSLIHATYFDLDEIAKLKKTNKKNLRKKETRPAILLKQDEMRRLKKKYLHNYSEIVDNKTGVGIPQGTSISALFANTYMIDFDKTLNEFIKSNGGIYRRYSDDILIVVPYSKMNELCTLFEVERKKIDIQISPNKTRRFHIINGKIEEVLLKI